MTGFFEYTEGTRSMGRLIAFMFSMYAIIASAYTLYKDNATEAIAVFSAISAIALSGKLIQQSMETKNVTPTKTPEDAKAQV